MLLNHLITKLKNIYKSIILEAGHFMILFTIKIKVQPFSFVVPGYGHYIVLMMYVKKFSRKNKFVKNF